jgi:hypothetical protein
MGEVRISRRSRKTTAPLSPPRLPPIVIHSRGPVCDDGDLTTVEFVCASPLPSDFQTFLRTWNGGVPQSSTLVLNDRTDVLANLYSIRARNRLHDLIIRQHALRGLVPAAHLAIGAFVSGALLVMCLEPPPRFGAIYHLTLPRQMERKTRLRYVASSFTALLSKLS